MTDAARARAYWRENRGLGAITPAGKDWPEGNGFAQWFPMLVGDGAVLEYGCGTGRLATLFDPERYVGVDVSRVAIHVARLRCPAHSFVLAPDTTAGGFRTAFAHTVLLHIHDDDIGASVGWLCEQAPRVLVSEIMSRKWRRPGDPPVFNREPAEYDTLFAERAYRLSLRLDQPYAHYPGELLTLLEFTRQ